jgi:hypothetical protein
VSTHGYGWYNVVIETESIGLLRSTDFYKGMQYFAEYGPDYRRVTSIVASSDMKEALLEVRGLQADLAKYVTV